MKFNLMDHSMKHIMVTLLSTNDGKWATHDNANVSSYSKSGVVTNKVQAGRYNKANMEGYHSIMDSYPRSI